MTTLIARISSENSAEALLETALGVDTPNLDRSLMRELTTRPAKAASAKYHRAYETPRDRFARKCSEPDANGCIVWTGAKFVSGHGHFIIGGKSRRAHRIMWLLTRGPVADGLELDHLCRNPACVNVDHLEPVTHRENVLRGESIAARYARRTHCPNGHEFNAENTAMRGSMRRCKVCRRK